MKLSSIPESEPLYKIIKSRVINPSSIKNEDERKYWRELKKENKIPDVYKSTQQIEWEMKEAIKQNKGGIENVK